jgi:hypothetical protein
MSTFNPRRFAQVDILRQIDPGNLLVFLNRHSTYLTGRGLSLTPGGSGELNLEKLATILLQPTEDVDTELVEALFILHELSGDDRFEELCRLAEETGVSTGPESSPADIALAIWLKDPMCLRRSHAQILVLKPRSYHYYQSDAPPPAEFFLPDETKLSTIADRMDLWFANKNRGTGARVFAFDAPEEDKVYFLIRHGMPFKREGKIENGTSSSVFYRPEFHDVIIYDRANNDLAVFNKSQAKGERAMYVAVLGEELFGKEEYFTARERFTLEPLREYGKDALSVADIDGIDWIRLIELQIKHPSVNGDFQIRRSRDFFAMLAELREPFPTGGTLHAAKFSVKFTGSKDPRTAGLAPPYRANYERNEDAHLLETWFRKRDYIIPRDTGEVYGLSGEDLDVFALG